MPKVNVFCSQCGESVALDSKFCPSCGATIISKIKDSQENQNDSKKMIAPINEETLVEIESLKIERKNDNIKFISVIICMIIIWFIAINPIQGNPFGITYLDFALMECELGEGEVIEFLGEELANTADWDKEVYEGCKETRHKALLLVVGAVILFIIMINYAFNPGKGKLQRENKKAETEFTKAMSALNKKTELEAELKKMKTERKILIKKMRHLEKEWEFVEEEWHMLQEKITLSIKNLKIMCISCISSGILLGLILLLVSAIWIEIPEPDLEKYLAYLLYISWIIPLILWVKSQNNLSVKSDNPILKVKNSKEGTRNKLTNLDNKITHISKKLSEGEE